MIGWTNTFFFFRNSFDLRLPSSPSPCYTNAKPTSWCHCLVSCEMNHWGAWFGCRPVGYVLHCFSSQPHLKFLKYEPIDKACCFCAVSNHEVPGCSNQIPQHSSKGSAKLSLQTAVKYFFMQWSLQCVFKIFRSRTTGADFLDNKWCLRWLHRWWWTECSCTWTAELVWLHHSKSFNAERQDGRVRDDEKKEQPICWEISSLISALNV